MAITATTLLSTSSTTNTTANTFTLTAAAAAGHKVIVALNTPTTNAITSLTVTDSKSNTWSTRAFDATTASSRVTALAGTTLASSWTTSDTITVTSNVFVSSWMIVAVDFGNIAGLFDLAAHNDTGATTSAAPTISCGSAARESHQLVVAAFTNTNTTHTFTAPGHNVLTNQTNGTGATTQNLHVVWDEVSSSGTRSVTGVYNTAAGYGAAIATYSADAGIDRNAKIGGVYVPTTRLTRSGGSWV